MKKILVFGASNSQHSINQQFAKFAAQRLAEVEITLLDLNDFEMPLYGIDREKRDGIPARADQFLEVISAHDGLVVSLAEHNSNYTTAFKNILDWCSRTKKPIWQNKPMFLLSTSPGKRGGGNVMGIALKFLPFMGANIVANFSLPSFHQNFSTEQGIVELELAKAFEAQLEIFAGKLESEEASLK